MIIQYTTDKIKTNHFNLLDSLSTCISKIFLTDNLISNLKATGPFEKQRKITGLHIFTLNEC